MTLEACAQVQDARLAFDVGVKHAGADTTWLPTDTDPRFRIERGGCFRCSSPLPTGVTASDVTGLRIRAYARAPAAGKSPLPAPSVTLNAVTTLFILNDQYLPTPLGLTWNGALNVSTLWHRHVDSYSVNATLEFKPAGDLSTKSPTDSVAA